MSRRSYIEMAADILFDVKVRPRPKTRLAARCGVNNRFMEHLIANGLLAETERKRAVITDKGNEYLRCFEALGKLFPNPNCTRPAVVAAFVDTMVDLSRNSNGSYR